MCSAVYRTTRSGCFLFGRVELWMTGLSPSMATRLNFLLQFQHPEALALELDGDAPR
jgi:hypothetical protein